MNIKEEIYKYEWLVHPDEFAKIDKPGMYEKLLKALLSMTDDWDGVHDRLHEARRNMFLYGHKEDCSRKLSLWASPAECKCWKNSDARCDFTNELAYQFSGSFGNHLPNRLEDIFIFCERKQLGKEQEDVTFEELYLYVSRGIDQALSLHSIAQLIEEVSGKVPDMEDFHKIAEEYADAILDSARLLWKALEKVNIYIGG